jgi:hypothetical protein
MAQARQQAMLLPEDPPWWELFNATKEEITIVSKTILTLYACVTRSHAAARRCRSEPSTVEYCGVEYCGLPREDLTVQHVARCTARLRGI